MTTQMGRAMGDGAGRLCECGVRGETGDQLVCRGCFVPYALLVPPGPAPPIKRPGGRGAGIGAGPQHAARSNDAGRHAVPTMPAHNAPRGPVPTRPEARRGLRLHFTTGYVDVPIGSSVRLGRDPALCPNAAILAGFDNLSRSHATIGVDPEGRAWVRDEHSTNGTYLAGRQIPPDRPETLHPGDALRLAADVNITVQHAP